MLHTDDRSSEERLKAIEDRIAYLEASFFRVSTSSPEKVVDGMIRFADGANWNPGSGKGLYQFIGGVWQKL